MRGQSTSYTRCLWGTPIRVRDYVGNDDVWDIIERGHEATHHLLNLSRGSQREYALDCETVTISFRRGTRSDSSFGRERWPGNVECLRRIMPTYAEPTILICCVDNGVNATTKCAAEKGYVEEYVDSGQCGPINEIKRYKETTAVVRYCAPANQGCTFLHCSFFALLSRIIARELPENPLESIICNEKTQKRKISKFKDHPSSHPQC
ncbi:uncharacterized protein LOC105735710 [Apis florea]|uniref:uncharacterized protein LOC105735710 n=1 Tax=Apis florea TaxID=7463 RepID=UPI00062901C5|nr:uncharacterized protein LOC105735710 [Apis florea]